MQLHDLRSPDGARTPRQRVGRGTGSGRGKTSGRGQKGALARGQGFRLGFEGGQMPLAQRLPKLGGFKNPFKKQYAVVNLTRLNRFPDGSTVDVAALYEAGLAKRGESVKLLGAGTLRRALTVEVHACSEGARTAVEARGGTLTLVGGGPVRKGPRQRRAARPAAAAAAPEPAGGESQAGGPGSAGAEAVEAAQPDSEVDQASPEE